MTKRLFQTRSGKLVDINETRSDEHGLYGWAATLDRKSGQYRAVAIFVPTA